MARDTSTSDLFEAPPAPAPLAASMDYRRQVSAIVAQALKDAPIDRYEVAALMSKHTGREVSKSMLDGYTAESREAFNLPLYLVPAFEVSVQSFALSRWLPEVRGGRLLIGRDMLDAEIGRLQRQRDQASAQLRQLRKLTGGSR
jgi:hypothetical protein